MKKQKGISANCLRDANQFPKDTAYYMVMWSLPFFEKGIEPHERTKSQYDFLWGAVIVSLFCALAISLKLLREPFQTDATSRELFSVIGIAISFFAGGLVLGLKHLRRKTLCRYTVLACTRKTANGLAKSHIYLFGLFSMAMIGLLPFFGLLICIMGFSFLYMISSVVLSLLGLVIVHIAASRCWSFIDTNLPLQD